MKAKILTIDDFDMTVDIDAADTPVGIVRNMIKSDPGLSCRLGNCAQLCPDRIEPEYICFTLLSAGGGGRECEGNIPLCAQPSVRADIAEIEAGGGIPTFLVNVCNLVAAGVDYSMEAAKIVARIVDDVMGSRGTAKAYYINNGNDSCIEVPGYPIYNSTRTGSVFVVFPRSTFYKSPGKIGFKELQQAQCHYYQGAIGTAFSHPHVYTDGHPCWRGGAMEHAHSFITNIIETLTLQNVSETSVDVGRCASGVMGTGSSAVMKAREQNARVKRELKCDKRVSKHIDLEAYVLKSFISRISRLITA